MKPSSTTLAPLPFWKAIFLFACTSAPIYFGIYVLIPVLQSQGMTFLSGYLICFYTTFAVMFFLALFLYWQEGNPLTWEAFKSRYRLQPVKGTTWLWVLGLFVFGMGGMAGLAFTGKWLASFAWLAPPAFFPPEINPLKAAIPDTFMGTSVHGQWGYALGYFAGWFFNIFGEELLWRGYMLPRQEANYGKWAWVVHSLLWLGWHIYWKWNLLAILPIALGIPFVVQQTKNTWIGIMVHGTMNFIPLIALVYYILK